jgi:peptide/nickel transport system substrate-binding protein
MEQDQQPGKDGVFPDRAITRRDFVKGVAGVGAAVTFGSLFSACGGSGSSTASSSLPASAGSPVKGGNLRLGVTGGSTADTLLGYTGLSTPDIFRAQQLYDTLLMRDHEFKIVNALAEEVSPTDKKGQVWTIRVRPDVTFHNGKTLTADDVIFSFKHVLDPKFPNGVASTLVDIDPNRMKKLDERTVELTLKRPNAVLDEILCYFRMFIVPVGFDIKVPVGTGPFKFKTFKPGVSTLFLANENYWGEGPWVDQVETIDFSDDAANVNALLGGVVDMAAAVPFSQVPTLKSTSGIQLVFNKTGNTSLLYFRYDQKPYSDPLVSQAMHLIADRAQMVQLAFGGYGEVGNDLWSVYDADYPHDMPQREQDIEKAKALLKQAGQENMSEPFFTAPYESGQVEGAQVFVQQAKAAGVNFQLKQIPSGVYMGDKYATMPAGGDFFVTRSYLLQVRSWQTWNCAHWDDPEYDALINKAFATTDPAARAQIKIDAWQIEHERSTNLIWGFNNKVDGATTKLKGLVSDPTLNFNGGHVNEIWFG